MIPKAEGIHAWLPPGGSGRLLTNPVRTPNPDSALGLWSGAAGFWNAAATVKREPAGSIVPPLGLPACVKVDTPGAASVEGCRVPVDVVKGVTYAVSAYIRGAVGGEVVQMRIGDAGGTSAQTAFDARSASFNRVFVTFTAGQTGTAQLAFTGPAAKTVQTFFVAAACAPVGPWFLPYFPLPAQLLAGRAAFTGASYESPSTYEAPAIELGRVKDDSGAVLWPRFELLRVTGLSSTGEGEANADRPPGAGREIARRSERRGKTVTYEGILKARDLVELREAEALFAAAFDDLEGEGRMDVAWHPLLLASEPGLAAVPPKFYEARALDAVIVDYQEGQQYWRSFVVGLRMSDRRYFDEGAEVYTVEAATSNVNYPFV